MNVACYQLVMPSMIHFLALFLLFSSPPCFAISPPHLVALGTAYLDSGAPMAGVTFVAFTHESNSVEPCSTVCAVDAASGKVTKVTPLPLRLPLPPTIYIRSVRFSLLRPHFALRSQIWKSRNLLGQGSLLVSGFCRTVTLLHFALYEVRFMERNF
jgi:hypothetical protein